jgi:3-deoxy-7-phosphoheptulonate synthase
MLANIANPVACKIDATVTPSFIATLCRQLNPQRIPGRLTFISRFGRSHIHRLGALIQAAGNPKRRCYGCAIQCMGIPENAGRQ